MSKEFEVAYERVERFAGGLIKKIIKAKQDGKMIIIEREWRFLGIPLKKTSVCRETTFFDFFRQLIGYND